MITIRVVNREPVSGEPEGMTAKQWGAQLRLRQIKEFKRAIKTNVNREIRKTMKRRLAELRKSRQEAMKNWTKQP